MSVFSGLYALRQVDEPDCWKSCSGGFCCSNNHPDFKFNFMTQQGTEIIYLPREYILAEKVLKTFNNLQGRAPKAFKLDLSEVSIGLVYTRCSLLGKCDGVVDKPLLCHLYPFLPIYTYDGELERLEKASVFDVTFEVKNRKSPCTVGLQKQYTQYFSRSEVVGSYDTYTRFYLRCSRIFAELMRVGIHSNIELMALEGKRFWERWELLHLAGKLIDIEKLRHSVEKEYAKAQTFDDKFSLADEAGIIQQIREL